MKSMLKQCDRCRVTQDSLIPGEYKKCPHCNLAHGRLNTKEFNMISYEVDKEEEE